MEVTTHTLSKVYIWIATLEIYVLTTLTSWKYSTNINVAKILGPVFKDHSTVVLLVAGSKTNCFGKCPLQPDHNVCTVLS